MHLHAHERMHTPSIEVISNEQGSVERMYFLSSNSGPTLHKMEWIMYFDAILCGFFIVSLPVRRRAGITWSACVLQVPAIRRESGRLGVLLDGSSISHSFPSFPFLYRHSCKGYLYIMLSVLTWCSLKWCGIICVFVINKIVTRLTTALAMLWRIEYRQRVLWEARVY